MRNRHAHRRGRVGRATVPLARLVKTPHWPAEDEAVAIDASCAMRHSANPYSVITRFDGQQDREIAQTPPAAPGDFRFGHL
jgi:hypothetical protein